jgi:hypothetical protein
MQTQMPYNWWMDQEKVVYVHNGVLFNHKEELRMWFEGKWMQLEDIMLNEVSQNQKDKGLMSSLICAIVSFQF